jgi:hypothetical protein
MLPTPTWRNVGSWRRGCSPLPGCELSSPPRRSVGIGRQGGFKIHCPQGRAGSSPASGTAAPCGHQRDIPMNIPPAQPVGEGGGPPPSGDRFPAHVQTAGKKRVKVRAATATAENTSFAASPHSPHSLAEDDRSLRWPLRLFRPPERPGREWTSYRASRSTIGNVSRNARNSPVVVTARLGSAAPAGRIRLQGYGDVYRCMPGDAPPSDRQDRQGGAAAVYREGFMNVLSRAAAVFGSGASR